MRGAAGVVLAGGRSSRMGSSKAALEWHGSTLLRRTVGILARFGPVVVVRAAGQDLPPLPPDVAVVDDPRPGKGPLQGIAAGLAAIGGRAEYAFVCATDLPFLHPAFVRLLLDAASSGDHPADVALPVARGFPQPLAAAYRTAIAPLAEQLVARERLRPAFLFDECSVLRLDEAALTADPVLAALDPELDSVLNVNEPASYQAARKRPAPTVIVRWPGPLAPGHGRPETVGAATIGQAAAAAGISLGSGIVAVLNGGDLVTRDKEFPLADGDTVLFVAMGASG